VASISMEMLRRTRSQYNETKFDEEGNYIERYHTTVDWLSYLTLILAHSPIFISLTAHVTPSSATVVPVCPPRSESEADSDGEEECVSLSLPVPSQLPSAAVTAAVVAEGDSDTIDTTTLSVPPRLPIGPTVMRPSRRNRYIALCVVKWPPPPMATLCDTNPAFVICRVVALTALV
jgi:hypothetical protein